MAVYPEYFVFQAIGEPPLFLASSIFFAIYDAVSAAQKEEGLSGPFRFDSPATAEKIRMACVDRFTKQVICLNLSRQRYILDKTLSYLMILNLMRFFFC